MTLVINDSKYNKSSTNLSNLLIQKQDLENQRSALMRQKGVYQTNINNYQQQYDAANNSYLDSCDLIAAAEDLIKKVKGKEDIYSKTYDEDLRVSIEELSNGGYVVDGKILSEDVLYQMFNSYNDIIDKFESVIKFLEKTVKDEKSLCEEYKTAMDSSTNKLANEQQKLKDANDNISYITRQIESINAQMSMYV